MFLKSIDVQGFKSFANRIKFEFNDGITGIVGPNGSGKSNVADAVRWVLGEQKVKQLRGGNMQDVIFSGTESRKPMSFASVSITLDNSDHALPIEYEEVTVSRRLYRSGESEYLLNGSICRLKDINELFYDTGIGKEGYSIIGQGQIDRILSEKPEDRRELFDEAAGIVKFKRRKAITQKKLEDEHGNLLRVTDILSEIEKQLGPLKEQSETAKNYLLKKDELKSYDINMFLLETERIREYQKELEEKIKIVSDEFNETNSLFADTKDEYAKVEEELDLVDHEIEEAKDQLNKTNILKQQLEGQIEVLKEQINTANTNEDHFLKRTETIDQEINNRRSELENIAEEITELSEEKSSINALLLKSDDSLKESALFIENLENDVENIKKSIIDALNERATTKAKLLRYDTIIEQNTLKKAEMNQKVIKLKQEDIDHEEELSKINDEIKTVYDTAKGFTDKADQTEDRINTLSEELDAASKEQEELTQNYHKYNSRLESLKNMTERYEGYGGSIRKVMEKKDHNKGIIGVVADIIKTKKEYELAIETALGGSIQNIVVDDDETAKQMIRFLKDNRLGRATFLPLTSVKSNSNNVDDEVLNEKGVIDTAAGLVEVDYKFYEIKESLLGRIFVVDNIDNAIKIARKFSHSLKLVTLGGEFLSPGGSISGGAFKNSSNLLGRKREIEELEAKVNELSSNLENINSLIDDKKAEKTACYKELDEINEKLRELKISLNTLELKADNLSEQKELISKELSEIENERLSIETEIKDIKLIREKLNNELNDSETFEKNSQNQIGELNKSLDEKRAENEDLRNSDADIRVKIAEVDQKISFVNGNKERIENEITRFNEELTDIAAQRTSFADDVKEKQNKIVELQSTIKDSAELFEEINKSIEESSKKREELNKEYRGFIEKREELSSHISELDKEAFRLNAKKEGYDKAYEDQISYMWEEYEITLNRAYELRDENLTNLSFIKKQISSLKAEIKAMGPVNVNAIEDYKEQQERYTFLNTQREDLVSAENALLEIIKELDEGMRKQFEEQFAQIKLEFNTVFKKLFGGGSAALELVEDEDILDAGIRIIAQPPGKKLQNMLQMSGGEKALTAIALLFSIQNLKPSPFCLLDEIEAALDDANVKRFADYLKFLTTNTQFIMITHRRGTMAVADRLYGITMQEKGVSTLVSVDLLEDKLDA